MIRKSAKVTQSSETRAHVIDSGCRGGLNIGHLRAFVEQADIAGLPDETHVNLTDKLQSSKVPTAEVLGHLLNGPPSRPNHGSGDQS